MNVLYVHKLTITTGDTESFYWNIKFLKFCTATPFRLVNSCQVFPKTESLEQYTPFNHTCVGQHLIWQLSDVSSTLSKVVCLFSVVLLAFLKIATFDSSAPGVSLALWAMTDIFPVSKRAVPRKDYKLLSLFQADDLGDITSWPTPSEIANNEVSVLCNPQDYYYSFLTMLAYLLHTIHPRMCFESCGVSVDVLSVIQDSGVFWYWNLVVVCHGHVH